MAQTEEEGSKKKPRVEDDELSEVDNDDEEANYANSEQFALDRKLIAAELSSDESDSDGEDDRNQRSDFTSANESSRVVGRSVQRASNECGKIKKIEVWDFMCHKRLEVDFSPVITCITGSNGSGKSAIVAALQICLGMNASDTKRAGKLAELIRNGAPGGAKIQVHVTNDGPRAFRQEEYGRTVIVERTIAPNGLTQSKIINGDGNLKRVVRTKKRDVEELAEELALYVDNPCCVLDQDTAKQFLKGSGKDKYQFFLTATDLATIVREFRNEKEEKGRAQLEYERNQLHEEQLGAKYKAAKKEYENLNDLRDLDTKFAAVNNTLAWALVRDKQVEKEEAAKIVSHLQRDLHEREVERDQLAANTNQFNEELDGLKSQAKTLKETQTALQQALVAAKSELKDRQAPIKKLKVELESKEDELQRISNDKKDLNKKIQLVMARMEGSGSASLERINADLAAKTRAREDLEANAPNSISTVVEEKADVETELEAARKETVKSRSKSETLQKQIGELEQQLKSESSMVSQTSASRYSELAKFHSWAPKLMEQVSSSTAFRAKPILIGQHVRLAKPEYHIPVELVINSSLGSFIVGSIEDEKKLRAMAVNCGARTQEVSVFVRQLQSERMNISGGRPDPKEWLTIADALEIDDPNVFNTLVDQHRIEAIVLLKDDNEKEKVWLGSIKSTRLPERVISAYAISGNSFTVKGSSRVFESMQRDPRTLRLLSGESAATTAKAKVDHLQDRLVKAKGEQQQVYHEFTVHQANLSRLQTRLKGLAQTESSFTQEVERFAKLKAKLDEEIEALMARIQDMSSDRDSLALQRYRDELKSHDQEEQSLLMAIASDKEVIATAERNTVVLAEQRVKEVQGEIQAKKQEEEEVRHRLDEVAEDHKPHNHQLAEAETAVKETAQKIVLAQKTVATCENELKNLEEGALSMCPEPVDLKERKTAEIRKEKGMLKEALEKEQRRAAAAGEGVPERLMRVSRELERCKKSYENVKADRKAVKRRISILKKSMKNRKKRFEDFRRFAEESTRELFSEYLRQRGQDGDVIFDHEKGEIEIRWFRKKLEAGTSTQLSQEDDGDEENTPTAFTDAKSMSGGERSSATLALLLAFGRNVQGSLRVMDEFDVFMDAGARKISLQQIIADARQTVNGIQKQYILLSPMNFAGVDDSPDVRKLRIEPDAASFGKGGSRQTQSVMDQFMSAN